MIVGLAGYARSGKDTVGKILVEDFGFRRIALADKMKEALAILNPIIQEYGDYSSSANERLDSYKAPWAPTEHGGIDYETAKNNKEAEVRRLLQVFGTEVGRNLFGPDFWIKQAFKDVIVEYPDGSATVKGNGDIVVTDIRFPNEATFIESHHGKTFWIHRPGIKAANGHISELAMTPEMCDGRIYNNRKNYREHLRSEIERRILK